MKPEVLVADGDELGEGPHWDAATGELLRVDITAGRVHRLDPVSGRSDTIELGDLVGFVIPREGGGLVVGLRRAVVLLDADGSRHTLATLEPDRPENRFNDAKCDAAGRLWAGTMPINETEPVGALYRVEGNGRVEQLVTDLTIANGLDWSLDAARMYFIDTPTGRIDVFDHDRATGAISDRRPFARIDQGDGTPDGLTVDAEGGVWVALFGGSQVRRYSPDGRLDTVVPLPVTNITSLTFGGQDYADLFVTTARHHLDAAQRTAQPLAGAVFVLRPGVRGRPAGRFAG
ncbi:MAG TPA: SMP-30/gluconolactonase/LRE family protein [Pseudonocardia sp.]